MKCAPILTQTICKHAALLRAIRTQGDRKYLNKTHHVLDRVGVAATRVRPPQARTNRGVASGDACKLNKIHQRCCLGAEHRCNSLCPRNRWEQLIGAHSPYVSSAASADAPTTPAGHTKKCNTGQWPSNLPRKQPTSSGSSKPCGARLRRIPNFTARSFWIQTDVIE